MFDFRVRQSAQSIVDISQWARDDEVEIFPVGSRAKRVIYAPGVVDQPFLLPQHRYLFKLSIERHPVQFWSEIIAYEVGRECGIPVPPAYVAIDSKARIAGALIEFFYGYPTNRSAERYVSGVEYLDRTIRNFDRKKGSQHNVQNNLALTKVLERMYGLKDGLWFWASVFVFDALIGNTDRHQENWGVIWTGLDKPVARFAPAFDNGTSLAYEILEDRVDRLDAARMNSYIGRGTHHIRWHLSDADKPGHAELCVMFAKQFESLRPRMIAILDRIDFNRLAETIHGYCEYEVPVRFSQARAGFVLRLIQVRHERLRRLLTEQAR